MAKAELSPATEQVLRRAGSHARSMGHSYVGTEHFLLALLGAPGVGGVLRQLGWEERELRSVLLLEYGAGGGRMLLQSYTAAARGALRQANREAKRQRQRQIEPQHLLLALLRQGDCSASRLLQRSGANLDIIFSRVYEACRAARQNAPGRDGITKLLDLYCENMLEKAAETEPVVGREREIAQLLQVLSRKNKNNPALIGEPGVGKTAIVEGLAQRLAAGRVPEPLRGKRLYCLNMASLLAGTKYRGEFEERVRDLLAEIHRCGNMILFVDEMHTLSGAGSAEGAIDAANLLKPALGRGEVQMIGATTLEEYRKHIEKDAALERRFRPITVREPSRAETEQILTALRPGLERHHGVRISQEAISAAVELSCRYLTERFLPDKAVDLLDESAARIWLSQERDGGGSWQRERQEVSGALEAAVKAGRYEQAAGLRDRLDAILRRQAGAAQRQTVIGAEAVAATVADRTGIPLQKLTTPERARLLSLREALRERIVGQDEAVEQAARAVLRGRMGLAGAKRPTASLLLTGPSGTGKTELCRALAVCVFGSEDALVRVDMSEYTELSSISRLIGAPPGYIGHDEGGMLTEKVRRRPYCVVLLDELEKAHRDVTNLLLQILEDGVLTDSYGRAVNFKNTIVVMTSNLGSQSAGKGGLGFTPDAEAERWRGAVREAFRPELLGRIDCIVPFRRLSREDLCEIARRMLRESAARANEQGVALSAAPEVASCIAARCEGQAAGARAIRHHIQSNVEDALADLMLTKPGLSAARAMVEAEQIVIRESDANQ